MTNSKRISIILVNKGGQLQNALSKENFPEQWEEALEKAFADKKERDKFNRSIPSFKSEYQIWYSEAKALVLQLIPHRLDDFIRHYQKPKPRKEIGFENYRIEDALQGLVVTNNWQEKKGSIRISQRIAGMKPPDLRGHGASCNVLFSRTNNTGDKPHDRLQAYRKAAQVQGISLCRPGFSPRRAA
ncbi:MAG: hypothetical protein U5L08_05420 [Xanthomonadales bacterium]|nr:hypothetical protein [Xanthomonadales bacterium]